MKIVLVVEGEEVGSPLMSLAYITEVVMSEAQLNLFLHLEACLV